MDAPARLLIVKVGTSTLTGGKGQLDGRLIISLARELAQVREAGWRPVLVSSGAVGAGRGRLGLEARPKATPEKQAVAAVGQGILMATYAQAFGWFELPVAQVLLTRNNLADRQQCLNVRNTLDLLTRRYQTVPIINENDTVATEELEFGDNDVLSAMLAALVSAERLIILSDIDGLYTADPGQDPAATRLGRVDAITPEIIAMAGGSRSGWGRGGMASKIEAAKVATASGVRVTIARGEDPAVIGRILANEDVGTTFAPQTSAREFRKFWIAHGATVAGRLHVDAGAVQALAAGRSLLPAGVREVEGEFRFGDTVAVLAPDQREVARGLVNYSAAELAKLAGVRSDRITEILGSYYSDEAIHRNNLALL